MYGRPGAVYLDVPGNIVMDTCDESTIPLVQLHGSNNDIPKYGILPWKTLEPQG